jgi:hypothetical protein
MAALVKDPTSAIAAAMVRLNKNAASVFPIQFHTLSHINGATMQVIVSGSWQMEPIRSSPNPHM